jgi:hypothetical protein
MSAQRVLICGIKRSLGGSFSRISLGSGGRDERVTGEGVARSRDKDDLAKVNSWQLSRQRDMHTLLFADLAIA